MKKILLLADQPFQLAIFSEVAKNLVKLGFEPIILMVDFFTFLYGAKFIIDREKLALCKIYTLEKLFIEWQGKFKPLSIDDFDFMRNWEKKYCSSRSLETIFKSDAITNGFEFDLWYLKLSDKWKKRIQYDILQFCEDFYLKFSPDIIVSIDNCTLPTNLLFTMSKIDNKKFITFQNARVANRWVARLDFAYGMDERLYSEIINSEFSREETLKAKELVHALEKKSEAIYNSFSLSSTKDTEKKLQGLKSASYFLKDLKLWLIYATKQILFGNSSRKYRVRRVDQSFLKVVVSQFRAIFTPYFYNFFRNFVNLEDIGSKYFFWPLHFRPEGSGLVLGDGVDEVIALKNFAELLPKNAILLVKENPLMYGSRKFGFYKNLINHPKIVLLNPYSNSILAIKKSLAVVGISGTALLEGSILKIPTWSFGNPEFLPFLSGNGWVGVDKFISNCISGEFLKDEIDIFPYICYIMRNSSEADVPLFPASDPYNMPLNINRMLNYITSA